MNDRIWSVSATKLAAGFLWIVAIGLLTVSAIVHNAYSSALGMLAVAISVVAMTVTVRGYFCTFSKQMKNAFDLGREVERERSASRLHKV